MSIYIRLVLASVSVIEWHHVVTNDYDCKLFRNMLLQEKRGFTSKQHSLRSVFHAVSVTRLMSLYLHCYSTLGNDARMLVRPIGGVCILRCTLNTQCTALPCTVLPFGMVLCILPCNPTALVLSCVSNFFQLICFYNKIYFILLSLFHCIMPLIQLNAFFNHG